VPAPTSPFRIGSVGPGRCGPGLAGPCPRTRSLVIIPLRLPGAPRTAAERCIVRKLGGLMRGKAARSERRDNIAVLSAQAPEPTATKSCHNSRKTSDRPLGFRRGRPRRALESDAGSGDRVGAPRMTRARSWLWPARGGSVWASCRRARSAGQLAGGVSWRLQASRIPVGLRGDSSVRSRTLATAPLATAPPAPLADTGSTRAASDRNRTPVICSGPAVSMKATSCGDKLLRQVAAQAPGRGLSMLYMTMSRQWPWRNCADRMTPSRRNPAFSRLRCSWTLSRSV